MKNPNPENQWNSQCKRIENIQHIFSTNKSIWVKLKERRLRYNLACEKYLNDQVQGRVPVWG